MRWVTFRSTADADRGADRVGLLVGDDVHALEPGVALVDLLSTADGLAEAGARAESRPAEIVALTEVSLRAPLPRPTALRDFSTFVQHMENSYPALGKQLPPGWNDTPAFYFTNHNAVVGPDDEVIVPGHSQRVDFELEVAAILGPGGRDLSPDEAEARIAGYCIFNDFSARDIQAAERIPVKGKDFANALGPYLVTPDEVADRRVGDRLDLTMVVEVNGREYGRDTLANMSWSFGQMIAFASRSTTVLPGDGFGSGTCGAGCLLELNHTHSLEEYPWLVGGDEVVLRVDRLGELRNRIVVGAQPRALR